MAASEEQKDKAGTTGRDARFETVSAAILVIGDEILSGRTRDRNINFLAGHLTAIGIDLREARVVPDRQEAIVAAVNALRQVYDYVFTTGGIGPTHDDITAEALAAAFGVELAEHEAAIRLLRSYYGADGLTRERRRMARAPLGAELVGDCDGHSPAFMIGNVFMLAGIPSICEQMIASITPFLRTGRRLISLGMTVSAKESDISALMRRHQDALAGIAIGSYPRFTEDGCEVSIVLRGPDRQALAAARAMLAEELAQSGAEISLSDPA